MEAKCCKKNLNFHKEVSGAERQIMGSGGVTRVWSRAGKFSVAGRKAPLKRKSLPQTGAVPSPQELKCQKLSEKTGLKSGAQL